MAAEKDRCGVTHSGPKNVAAPQSARYSNSNSHYYARAACG